MPKKNKNRTKHDTKQRKKDFVKFEIEPLGAEQERTRRKKEAVLKALLNRLGVISFACSDVGISRNTFYEWMKNDADFRQKVEEVPELVLDFAESSLYTQIAKGNTAAILFFLKTKGKARGYVEKEEVVDEDVEKSKKIDEALDFLAQIADE